MKEVCEAEGKQEDEKDEKDEKDEDADEENETAARLADEEESCWRYGVESGA